MTGVLVDRAVVVVVHGLPAPQGSKRYVGRGIMVESSKRVRPWREAVKHAALEQHPDREPLLGPVTVDVAFVLPRPASHWRTGRNSHLLRDGLPVAPTAGGDLDKLVRATLDAITDSGVVWRDDRQVVGLLACKAYPTVELLPHPGARIVIRPRV